MNRRTIYFTAPGQVELREESLPSLGADEVLIETICSAISAGTEMLIYQGRFPRDVETDSAIPTLRGDFKYPLAYGYAVVGKVVDVGKAIDKNWKEQLVFSFQPHTSHFIATADCLFPIPESISCESACFLPNMETAVNLLQDAAPILGERIMVFGQGVIGLLTTALLREFPLEVLVTADCYELRRKASLALGVSNSIDPASRDFRNQASAYLKTGADLIFELSGSPSALDDAIALATFSGRIVIGSWYGKKRTALNLGGAFHRSRIKLISSQVSTIAPELSGRWDKARRFDVAWNALQRIKPEQWITHRFSMGQVAEAYQLLDRSPEHAIQIVFNHRT
ncbi:MAG: zinc-binding alcohol dehydrogenase [Chloroflexi bacterium]|nr:zinc-binding alcohol dehydrogenase [Chloroflexota bacterium]